MAYAYYPVIPCGQQSSIAFVSNDAPSYPGAFIRFTSGVPAEFLGVCFHPDPNTVAPETVTIDWLNADYEAFTTCEACSIAPTPPLPSNFITYQFDACCGGDPLFYSFITPSSIVNGSVYLYTGASVGPLIPGCYTLTRIESITPFPFVDEADITLQTSCADSICQAYCNPCQCYTFTAGAARTTTVTALDCDNTIVTIILNSNEVSDKMCLLGIIDLGGAFVTPYGLCSDASGEFTCPGCYTLSDCQGILDPITSVNQSLAPYAGTGQSIQIEGYDTCWTVTFDELSDCPCAVNVNIQFVYTNCTTCLTPKGYKLTECTTGNIIYTTSDLSTYIGQTIEIDCGGCWTIEELDIPPPSNQPVTVLNSYTDCPACNATYYTLTKCGDSTDRIYTITDLSDLVGQVITLQFCPGECWQVTLGGQEGGIVLPENSYETCSECMLANNTCQCQTVTNNVGAGRRFNYYDCSGVLRMTPALALGATTAKTCLLAFTNPSTAEITNYGTCIDDECPPVPSPLLYRAVTPGYGTAVCSTEYYETVECNFSEWMYKDVLEKRYGISNCCPDELMKWEIKHEMLMLDILVNPNYVCQGVSGCGCNETHTPPPPCNS